MSLISSYMADTTRVVRIALSRRELAIDEMNFDDEDDVDDGFILRTVCSLIAGLDAQVSAIGV